MASAARLDGSVVFSFPIISIKSFTVACIISSAVEVGICCILFCVAFYVVSKSRVLLHPDFGMVSHTN